MLHVFFLDIADTTGDGFSYEILPAKDIADIPLQRNLVTLVRSVAHSRKLDLNDHPTCRVSPIIFQFYNRDGIELFGSDEEDTSHANLTQDNDTPTGSM